MGMMRVIRGIRRFSRANRKGWSRLDGIGGSSFSLLHVFRQ